MTPEELRAAFPVLDRLAYLNSGTCGPVPSEAVEAGRAELEAAAESGRAGATYFERMQDLRARLRSAYAARVGAREEDLALTTSTSDGMARVIAALELRHGDEILTSDDEHPGLYGALIAARERCRVRVRCVKLEHIADAIGPDTRLVACSHVDWITGALAPAALAQAEVPVLLDGAQGAGAMPVDVEELGCAFYAAAGQKWLCGPIGTGLLYVAPHMRARLHPATLGYPNLAEPDRGLAAEVHDDARALDTGALSPEEAATALAAHAVLDEFGWDAVYERAASLADRLASQLRARGIRVEPRGRTTLVAWRDNTPVATRDRLAAEGVVVRNLPRHALLRASVGAWNDEDDVERLLDAL